MTPDECWQKSLLLDSIIFIPRTRATSSLEVYNRLSAWRQHLKLFVWYRCTPRPKKIIINRFTWRSLKNRLQNVDFKGFYHLATTNWNVQIVKFLRGLDAIQKNLFVIILVITNVQLNHRNMVWSRSSGEASISRSCSCVDEAWRKQKFRFGIRSKNWESHGASISRSTSKKSNKPTFTRSVVILITGKAKKEHINRLNAWIRCKMCVAHTTSEKSWDIPKVREFWVAWMCFPTQMKLSNEIWFFSSAALQFISSTYLLLRNHYIIHINQR